MNLSWISQIIVRHPYVLLLAITVFSGTCLVIPFTLRPIPHFSEPQMGFETRGTVLANRKIAWKNLEQATRPSGPFAVNPNEFFNIRKEKFVKNKKKKVTIMRRGIIIRNISEDNLETTTSNWEALRKIAIRERTTEKSTVVHEHSEDFFCGAPDEGYVHFVVESKDGSDLFSYNSLRTLCRLEHEFIEVPEYKSYCQPSSLKKHSKCCRPWSLGNYIAQLHNRTTCLGITEEDVIKSKLLVKRCSHYFHTLNLAPDCSQKSCFVPAECVQYDAVYNILNYLVSISFHKSDRPHNNLTQTVIFLPVAAVTQNINYFHAIRNMQLTFGTISIVAMDFGIKAALFDEYLVRDIKFITCGTFFILLCIWFYTQSFLITIMTILAIIFSLGISYFLYTIVFRIAFFPFMNLLAVVVALGIGADNVFLFCKVWQSKNQGKNLSYVECMNATFHHAFLSMFITSVTTMAAFLASYLSSIIAIRCFSLFAAMSVMANWILMMTWTPAAVVISERSFSYVQLFTKRLQLPAVVKQCKILTILWSSVKCNWLREFLNDCDQKLASIVIHFRYIWLILFSVIAVASSVIVFYYPKLQLPSTPDFQLFESSNLFETYDMHYKYLFWFRKTEKVPGENFGDYKLPLRFVWGVLPVNNANYLDPTSLGKMELDESFDVSKPESQQWLLQFCRDLRNQPFYEPTPGPLLPNCFIETFMSWMQQRCNDSFEKKSRFPCCEIQKFPYNSSIFDICITKAMSDLYATPTEYFIPGMAGPKFSKDQFPTIKAVVVEYDSNYTYSMSYEHMHNFFTLVETWMIKKLQTAPKEMKGGFFISDLDFYDVQKVLSEGTMAAICVSMGTALGVLLLASLNIFTSLYAIVTITSSIVVTLAVLVALGWKLNILESITISVAIGLAVDYSLHYTVAYKICTEKRNRKLATKFAVLNMAGPSLMAALTTGAAGAFMMPSSILPYIQIGVFLITSMTVSWFFATFFLCSLLAVLGLKIKVRRFGRHLLLRRHMS
ncbi:protein dispatched isoform X2 [Agrilus planipennis]|uniref:Protein dispatched isoform X2 n=1 Tax=Agrilus planipennis TaxID=224129 RepID=A0A1W4WZR7_AGRPL|nr:protein dispatched isoform X2 [Agrilus planipennis]